MFRLVLLFSFSFLSISTDAQRMADFQLDDEKALQLGEEELELLLEKKWYEKKFIYHEKEIFNTHDVSSREAMILHRNYEVEENGFKFAWSIHPEQTILNFSPPNNHITRLSGSFAVWEISDTSLILAKVLTSQQDQAMVHHFTNKPKERDALARDAEYLELKKRFKEEAQRRKDAFVYEEIVVEGKRIKVRQLERQDLFMRKIRPEEGFAYYHTASGKLIKIAAKEE